MTSQIYMDDIILVLRGPAGHRNRVLAIVLYVLQMLGVQIALEKGERGQRVRWIGTTLELQQEGLMIGIQSDAGRDRRGGQTVAACRDGQHQRPQKDHWQKLSWIAGVIPRMKWVVNAFYSTMAAVQRDEAEGLEEARACHRSDTRPKKGLVPFKRLKNPIDWLTKLLQKKGRVAVPE